MREFAKAITGAIVTGLTYLVPVSSDGITMGEWLGTALAVVVGFNAVYWMPNRDENVTKP